MKYALFDFDGVVADTERLYDIFWDEMGERYETGIPHFAAVIKGSTLNSILKNYFADRPEAVKEQIRKESEEFDHVRMPFPPMPGSLEFIRMLKAHHIPTALVTSSDDAKMNRAFREMKLEGLFDTVITADKITQSKPNPQRYLLAAENLGASPADCLVFEDSFAGIEAGNAAGMRVIALATTNPAASLQGKAYRVIPDLQGKTFGDFEEWCR